MQRLEVSDVVRPLKWSLGVKGLKRLNPHPLSAVVKERVKL